MFSRVNIRLKPFNDSTYSLGSCHSTLVPIPPFCLMEQKSSYILLYVAPTPAKRLRKLVVAAFAFSSSMANRATKVLQSPPYIWEKKPDLPFLYQSSDVPFVASTCS